MINNETFRSILYSDETLFDTVDNKIALKRYKDNLLFYSSFDDTLNATFSIGNSVPVTTGTNSTENFGVFAQNVNLQGSITYLYDNFVDLTTEGTIKFRLKTLFNNGICSQTSIASMGTITTQTYTFDVYINGIIDRTCSVSLVSGMTLSQVLGAMVTPENLGSSTVEVVDIPTNKIKFYSAVAGDYIEVKNSGTNSLLTLFGGMNNSVLPNGPITNTTLLSFTNGTNNNNKIELIHTTTSNLIIKMYDKDGVLIVNKDFGIFSNSYYSFYSFAITWTSNLLILFIDGRIFGVESFDDLDRRDITTKLILTGTSIDSYRIDEFIIYSTAQDFKNYTVETTALTPYETNNPYIDINFGTGYGEDEVKDLNLVCSSNCSFVVKIGSTWYYYFSGSWRISDGTFSQSSSPGIMETKFRDLFFNADASLYFRIYFSSDGNTECVLDELSIIMEQGDEQPAVVIGSVNLTTPVNLTTNNKITIATNLGTTVVDVSSAALNKASVSLQDIKNSIDNAAVFGLNTAGDDGYGHLVLQTTTLGTGAFISVSEGATQDCLSIVWGFDTTDTGEEADTNVNSDYTVLYDYVRTSLGAPIVPVELTDGQLDVCLQEAVYEFNRWKNFKENIFYMTLVGNAADGWEIPAIVGGQDNIIDVIIKPRLPFGYFSTSADAAANIFVQYFFNKYGKPGANGFLTDYSLMISFQKDMGLILGTEPRWFIMNNRLFLQPRPSSSLAIGIEYRSSLSIDDIVNSMLIKRFVIAKAKLLLGNIRGTFGSSIPGGAENIQLNSTEMISQGTAELEAVKAEIKGQQEPLFMVWG